VIPPALRRPAHGGYPTPSYEEVPARRRAESLRAVGHTGAAVSVTVERVLAAAAAGRAHPYGED
jgi:hypothetical protein